MRRCADHISQVLLKKFPENVGIVARLFAKLIITCQSRDPKMAFHIAIFCNRMVNSGVDRHNDSTCKITRCVTES